jgi:putative ABC transport system permease protein
MNWILQDVRYAIRGLLAKPGFTVVALLTLSVGIGANTAIFSIVNTVLLRPLPYSDPSRLVALESVGERGGKNWFGGVSPADFWDFADRSVTLDLSLYGGTGFDVLGDRPETFAGARVSARFFEILGVQPEHGRLFSVEDFLPNAPRTVLLSHRLWQGRFGGDPSVVGQTLKTADGEVTIVGVMPPGFRMPAYADVWLPQPRATDEMTLRGSRYFSVVGRIKRNQSIDAARSDLNGIAAILGEQNPKDNAGWSVRITPLSDYMVRGGRVALLVLMGAVGFVMLISCVNVANLLMVRATSRRKEMAIRSALGAGRRRLLRQLLVESLVLSVAGAALGILLAGWGIDLVLGLMPKFDWTFQALSSARDQVRIDKSVLFFALGLSAGAGALFGVVPGIMGSQSNIVDCLRDGFRGTDGRAQRHARYGLVIAEISLATILLVGAGLLIESFARLRTVDLGYEPHGLMTASLALPSSNDSKLAFGRQVLNQVSAVPGIESVALMSYATFGGLNFPFNIETQPLPSGDEVASYSAISPGYFRTLGVQLKSGRWFAQFDTKETKPVAIVNETLARCYFAGESPLGKRIVIAYLNRRLTKEVVGVISDVKQDEPGKPTKPEIFVPFDQQPWLSAWLVFRTSSGDSRSISDAVQTALWSVNKTLAPSRITTVEATISEQVAAPRLYAALLGSFAAAAFLLVLVGSYGVVSYSVAQQTQEIGIRMALGATTTDVLRRVLKEASLLAVAGVVIGVLGALALTRLLQSLLFQVSATDPTLYGLIAVALLLVVLVASLIPASRAARVDPVKALRCE